MKKYFIVAVVALLVTSCEHYDRYNITKRGNEIYQTWNIELDKLNYIVNQTFDLNSILQAETKEEADSIYNECFAIHNYQVTNHAENVYQIHSKSSYDQNNFLIQTDGNDLNTPGTQWAIVLNLPDDFKYQPTPHYMTSCYTDLEPYTNLVSCGIEYLPFTVTCSAPDTWTWKDYNATAETLDYFSVDLTVTKEIHEIIPGLIEDVQYKYNGKGRFAVNRRDNYIDYEMTDMIPETKGYAYHESKWTGGKLDMDASNAQNRHIPVSVTFKSSGYAVTYSDVTEDYPYYH